MQLTQGRKGPRSKPLTINIDGPYGIPLDMSKHRSILLVAGGIGITPLFASYKHMYLSSQGADRYPNPHPNPDPFTFFCKPSHTRSPLTLPTVRVRVMVRVRAPLYHFY